MSGNYDFPPASGRAASRPAAAGDSTAISSRPPTTRSTAAAAAAATALAAVEAESGTNPRRLRYLSDLLQREILLRDFAPASTESDGQSAGGASSNVPAERRRRRAIIRNISQMRNNARGPLTQETARPSPGLEPRVRRRELPSAQAREAASELRAYLADVPQSLASNINAQEYSGEAEVNRRFKRRKLNSQESGNAIPKISYGHYGQVEPGHLRMEIVSCDGGNFPDGEGTDKIYSAENMLQNDRSVYCTKSSQCNILLQHPGNIPFCLSRLVVTAPQCGFTAPLQEGMVFVSMTSEDLLARTAAYRMLYPMQIGDRRSIAGDNLRLPTQRPSSLSLAGDESRMLYAHAEPAPDEDPLTMPFLYHVSIEREAMSLIPMFRSHEDSGVVSEAGSMADLAGTMMMSMPTPYVISTDSGDGEVEEDDANTPEVLAARARQIIARAMSEHGDGLEDDGVQVFGDDLESRTQLPVPKAPSRLELPRDLIWSSAGDDLDDGGPSQESAIVPPNARFFIKKDKHKCTITFDTPVSGRYILLKLWSPAYGENIDVQSIISYGFAGPRFFPSKEMR